MKHSKITTHQTTERSALLAYDNINKCLCTTYDA